MRLSVWEHGRDEAVLEYSAVVAKDRRAPPDFHIDVLSNRGDQLTVQVVSGWFRDPTAILHVESRGTFEIDHIEPWPSRVLVVLRRLSRE